MAEETVSLLWGFILVYKFNYKDTHFPSQFSSSIQESQKNIFLFSSLFYFLVLSSQSWQCWTQKSNIKQLEKMKIIREQKNIKSKFILRSYGIAIVNRAQTSCTVCTILSHLGCPSVKENVLLNLFCSWGKFVCQSVHIFCGRLLLTGIWPTSRGYDPLQASSSSHKLIEMCRVFVSFDYRIVIIMSHIALCPTSPLQITPKCTAGTDHTFLIKGPKTAKQIIACGDSNEFEEKMRQQVW